MKPILFFRLRIWFLATEKRKKSVAFDWNVSEKNRLLAFFGCNVLEIGCTRKTTDFIFSVLKSVLTLRWCDSVEKYSIHLRSSTFLYFWHNIFWKLISDFEHDQNHVNWLNYHHHNRLNNCNNTLCTFFMALWISVS